MGLRIAYGVQHHSIGRSTVSKMRAWVILFITVFAVNFAKPLAAGETSQLSDQDRLDIAQVEQYLNGINTLHARFVQISSNGALAEGALYVDRPGRMRFEYDPPHPIVMIANGFSFLYYDRELEEATFLPMWETPLWFFVREDINLSRDAKILSVQREPGVVSVTLAQKDKEDLGAITLVFNQLPMRLLRWSIDDAQGLTTQVSLLDLDRGIKLDDGLFDQSPYRPGGSSEDRG